MLEDLLDRAGFHHRAGPEHHDRLGDTAHEREIVGDEDHRDAPFGLTGAEQFHDDSLHRDIER